MSTYYLCTKYPVHLSLLLKIVPSFILNIPTTVSPPSLLPATRHLSSSPGPLPLDFLSRKEQAFKRQQLKWDTTRYSKTKQKTFYGDWMGQLNMRKIVPKACQRVRDKPAHTVRGPTRTLNWEQLHKCRPMQALCWPLLSLWSCVKLCLADSVAYVLLVYPTPSDSYSFSSPSSVEFPNLQ